MTVSGSSFGQQIRSNAVALLSLLIAISALGYNTWRNETTEEQRNIRSAAFRVLETLGELREVTDERYYYLPFREDMGLEAPLRLKGYGRAALTRDLMGLMPEPAPAAGQQLHSTWIEFYNDLDELDANGRHSAKAQEAEKSIGDSLQSSREIVLDVISGLN